LVSKPIRTSPTPKVPALQYENPGRQLPGFFLFRRGGGISVSMQWPTP
jgi:hypothetical protein